MHDLIRTLTADISPSAKLLATAFYAHAPVAGNLPVANVLVLVGLRTTGALRHLRGELAAADIVATSITDGDLSWQFLSASQPRAARPTDAQADPERVPQTRSTADSASQPRAARPTDAQADPVTPVTPQSARPTDALFPPQTPPGRQVGRLINLNQEENLPTPLPPTAPEEQARSIRLLRAISVNVKLAVQIAARWNFREVCAFVAVYLADHAAGKCNGAGVLQSRCLDPDSAAPQLAADALELNAVILKQHITPADRNAWRLADAGDTAIALRNKYVPAGYEDIVEH